MTVRSFFLWERNYMVFEQFGDRLIYEPFVHHPDDSMFYIRKDF
ncbi:hypothetical protein VCHA38O209_50263 [Vibrio chagasii]|nr:hypothetical protein VCHA38O209_50263 [Vibrio chagasii]